METPPSPYWLRARRYRWGWGLPTCWQGWVVMIAYFAAFAVGVLLLRDRGRPAEFIVYTSLVTAALLLVLWKKGEPPRWRWGGD